VNEKARHLIGARIELAVGDVSALHRDGGPVGVAAARVLDHVVEPLAQAPAGHGAVAQHRDTRRLGNAAPRRDARDFPATKRRRNRGVGIEKRIA